MSRSSIAGIGKLIAMLAICITAILALAMHVAPAFAETGGQTSNNGVYFEFGNDYIWAGESETISNQDVSNDLLAAGRTIDIEQTDVGGSVRAAGQNVELHHVAVQQNVTLAGETVVVDGGEANGVWMTGRTARFTGKCSQLNLYGDTVFLEGTVNGDVQIEANSIEIGPGAVVTGTLYVSSSAAPSIPDTAKIGSVEINVNEKSESSESSGFLGSFDIVSMLFTIIMTIVVALIAEWLARRHTAGAAAMLRSRTGAMVGTGIIGALVAPVAVILLCCLIVTLPVAAFAALALIGLTCIACGFMGASLFKLFFSKLGRYVVALIGGTIMGILSSLPILGGIIVALAFFYLLGYVLQSIYLSTKAPAPAVSAPAPENQ